MPNLRTDLTPDLSCVYNGYAFSAACKLGALRCEPIQDRSKRTFVAIKHLLTIVDWVTAPDNSNLDRTLASTRTTLLQPACTFTLTASGFGGLSINALGGGGTRDAMYGPWPRSFTVEDTGHNQTAKISWTVEITIPLCTGQTFFKGQPMEVDYTCTFSIDRAGLTRRSHTGLIRIPATRLTPQTRKPLPDSIDSYRSLIVPPIPAGFRRTQKTFSPDEQKTSMSWTIVDEELESVFAPPPGVIEVDEEHELHTEGRNRFRWIGTLRASYELIKGGTFDLAAREFIALANKRIAETQKFTQGDVVDNEFVQGKCSVIPLTRSMRQPKLRGKPMVSFNVTYSYSTPLEDAFKASAFGIAPPNNDWKIWNGSLKTARVLDDYGLAKLKIGTQDDAIIDLCVNLNPAVGNAPVPPAMVGSRQVVKNQLAAGGGGGDPWGFPVPPADASWLAYDLQAIIEVVDATVELKPLPSTPIQTVLPQVDFQDQTGLTIPYNRSTLPTSIAQVRAAPSFFITLQGMALRAGYEISMPHLSSVGGVTPVPMNQRGNNYFSSSVVANAGVPVVRALWRWTWLLPRWPGSGFSTPPNPVLGGIGSGGSQDGLSGFITQS